MVSLMFPCFVKQGFFEAGETLIKMIEAFRNGFSLDRRSAPEL